MSRLEAAAFIAQFAQALIAPWKAREVSKALGVEFDMLLFIAPNLVRRQFTGGWALRDGVGKDLVQVSDLGATICRYMNLYADGDHALASPHGTPGKQARYVGQRAAVRLARHFNGDAGVRDLAAAVKIQDVLLRERPYSPS